MQANIHAAQECLNLDHFGHVACRFDEIVKCPRRSLVERNSQRHGNFKPQRFPVNDRFGPLENAFATQFVEAPRGTSSTQPATLGKLGHGKRGIGLKQAKYAAVNVIKHENLSISKNHE